MQKQRSVWLHCSVVCLSHTLISTHAEAVCAQFSTLASENKSVALRTLALLWQGEHRNPEQFRHTLHIHPLNHRFIMASNIAGRHKSKYVEVVASIPIEPASAMRHNTPSDNTKAMFHLKTSLALIRGIETLCYTDSGDDQTSEAPSVVEAGKVNITVMVPAEHVYFGDDRDSDEYEQVWDDFANSKIEEITKAIQALPHSDFDTSPPVRVQTLYSEVTRTEPVTTEDRKKYLWYTFKGETKHIVLRGEQTVYDLARAIAKMNNFPLREQCLSYHGLYISVGTWDGIHPKTTLGPVGIPTSFIWFECDTLVFIER
jgi:hypothetical protein